jgi:phenylacetate-coenzyme A ligase PaaK-like adenylate-forming protein
VAAAWDERSHTEQRRAQSALLRQTVLQMALAHVPYVRARLATLGLDARVFKGSDELGKLPLVMRRDILDPHRNPEGPRALILQGTAEGVKRFSDRSVLWRIAGARLLGGEDVQELAVEAATRAVHVHLVPGPGGRIPVAYTRDDLDLLARAGSRLASLLGIEREDRLLNLVPFGPSLEFWGIFYMAHGVGMSALHLRRDGQELARAIAASLDEGAPTAVALPADEAAVFAQAATAVNIDLTKLRALVAVGRSLTVEERAAVGESLARAGAGGASIGVAYGPAEGRVLWGECAVPAGRTESFGLHTFPDMDLVELISPETGQPVGEEQPGEIVYTPLGFRGGGAPRWRTGDLALGGVTNKPCPNCGRTVPRVGPTVVRGAWQRIVQMNGRTTWIDLRDAGAAAAERAREWQVELVPRNGSHELYVYVAPGGEDSGPLIDLYEDLNRLRSAPTQIVVGDDASVAGRVRGAPGPWPRYWDRTADRTLS